MIGLPLLILSVALQVPASSLDQPATSLVSFATLQQRLGGLDLRLLDARSRADYEKGHIPGAVWVDVKAAEKLAARAGGLGDEEAWEAWIEPLGIGKTTHVLVYDARRQLDAARVWWLLTYLGVERVGLIDGGFALWQKQNRPITTDVAKADRHPFPIHFREDRLATRQDVLNALKEGKIRVVDARSEAEHVGTAKLSKRGGHVPDACPLEWSKLVDLEGRFLDESALRSLVASAGVRPTRPVITYCQGGGRSSVDAFILERLACPTRNYYLGWSDWGNADETPVETRKGQPDKSQ